MQQNGTINIIVDNNIPGKKLNFPKDYPNYNPDSVIKVDCEPVDDKTVKLIVGDKRVLIDKEDYDKVKFYTHGVHEGYVITTIRNKSIRIHRFLTNTTDPKIYVDHIDQNPLNNCKSNLRMSNAQKNGQNKSKRKNALSKYYGISYDKTVNRWCGQLKKDGKVLFSCSTKDEEHAARKRDLFILDNLKDDHYNLNFEWTEADIKKWKKEFKL